MFGESNNRQENYGEDSDAGGKVGCILRVVLGRGEERESRGKLARAVCCCRQLLSSSGQQPTLP